MSTAASHRTLTGVRLSRRESLRRYCGRSARSPTLLRPWAGYGRPTYAALQARAVAFVAFARAVGRSTCGGRSGVWRPADAVTTEAEKSATVADAGDPELK
jgi:hypothetical protein